MITRPEVVEIVRRRAFEALASQNVPDDATPHEEAEGLVTHALAILSRAGGGDAAADEVQSIVERYRHATHG